MKEVSFADLPLHSSWPARLLGLESFHTESRTIDKLVREYDKEKYVALSTFLKEHPGASLDELRKQELGIKDDAQMVISIHEKLYDLSGREAHEKRIESFLEAIASVIDECDTVVDIGAGYGYYLSLIQNRFPDHVYWGGELSENAITLGRSILPGIEFRPMNLFESVEAFLQEVPGERLLIYSSHTVEMMQDTKPFINALAAHKERIQSVVQFEPMFGFTTSNALLELLRRGYAVANDYNLDLREQLHSDDRVQIQTEEYDRFGLNPLFPESCIHWKFK